MRQDPITLTTNTTTELTRVYKRRGDANSYIATIFANGTFGGGTLTLLASPDGGTTKTALPNISGTAFSATSDTIVNIQTGNGNDLKDYIIIYAKMTGATTPSVTVTLFDNR